MSNVNMSVPNVIFEGKFSTYKFGNCLSLALSPSERNCCSSRKLFFEKNILNYIVCVEVLILVEK